MIFIIAIIFIAFLTFIPFLHVYMTIQFQHAQDDDQLMIDVRLLRFIRYRLTIPLIEISKSEVGIVTEERTNTGKDEKTTFTVNDARDRLAKVRQLLNKIVHLHTIMKKFLQHVSVLQFQWHTQIGVGDAAKTAVLVGVGWSVKYYVVAMISKYMNVCITPSISIVPFFQGAVSRTSFTCMIQFRIGYAILAGLKVVKHWKKDM
ncbi:DUF2953 domain-containing protein [Anoxybacillus flavithermus]|uniref:DUF2953 domain-containing protein n=1 Tax=Anoxybacillus flavithermus TaxID=33934 RepID=A0AAX1ZXY3_9BACL|nr:DUF2953 domain-containing protein [Anoxybacillus flavithermus]MBE2914506.1 DUF2953 domain-containing protein [Anoxybacillus flavithermus]MBE2919664.1 DUF2953 domain-containing protein [Anoxybacillus flavithermus]MBE2924770.1 DUF2953 domain-containing protein [Anoxybacillus flavithermus]OAO82910.1 hypothetical protein A0O32_0582 [Anoxybacillus flavithermus]RWU09756.1 DUF2953 domain-containing protein [Anoxybacillus flavithermus]